MKRPTALLLCLLMITISLAGCFGGDDNDSSEATEPIPALDDWDVYYVTSGADLPNCNSETLGRLYFVESDAGFQTCTSTGWSFIDLTGPAGTDGAPGADGADGVDGTNGTDGQKTLAVTSNEPSGSNCADGGIKIEVGVDDNDDGALQSGEVDQTTYVCNGTDGNDGVDGTNGSASPNTMLTSISSPSFSFGCTAGGRAMQQGLDNGDGGGTAQNGILESGEVDYTTTYCSKYVVWAVDDIWSGLGSANPGRYGMEILVGDTIYFDADNAYDGYELWAHDTSNHSTWQVADINSFSGADSYPGRYGMKILVGDTIYFSAYTEWDGTELWAHDTSNRSTWQVTDMNGVGHSFPGEYMAILVGDTIYFDADDGNDGRELWAHDTSNHSTWQVADINTGTGGFNLDSEPGYYMEILVGDTIYFDAMDGFNGTELWAHDTSNSSTWMVADINSGTSGSMCGWKMSPILVGDTIYFDARDGNDGHELWAHDTSNHSTWQVADINSGSSDSDPGYKMEILVGDTIYFDANDGSTGRELWAHDTSNHSTWLVADINSGSNSYPGYYMDPILVGHTIYFDADNAYDGHELWAHDTSNHSTWLVADINSGSSDSNPGNYMDAILVGHTIYFDAYDGNSSHEMWAHDTSNSSTWQVADINSGSRGSSPGLYLGPIIIGDTIYFAAVGGDQGRELWAMKIEHSIYY